MSVAKLIAMMGEAASATYVTEHHYVVSSPPQAVSFAGAEAGDLGIIISIFDNGVSQTGWAPAADSIDWAAGSHGRVYYRVLTAGDISAGSYSFGGVVAGAQLVFLAYRGATVATVVSSATGSSTTLAVPGFTKAQRSKAVLSYLASQQLSALSVPGGMTQRVAPFSGNSTGMGVADTIPSAAYANGASLTWSGFGAGSNGGQIIELT